MFKVSQQMPIDGHGPRVRKKASLLPQIRLLVESGVAVVATELLVVVLHVELEVGL